MTNHSIKDNPLQKLEHKAEAFAQDMPDMAHDIADPKAKTVLVPKHITIGLGIFAVILGLGGFAFRLAMGEDFSSIMPSLIKVVLIFWLGIPLFFVIGAKVMNRFSGKPPIQSHNAVTLGLLFTCVAMLWMMAGNA